MMDPTKNFITIQIPDDLTKNALEKKALSQRFSKYQSLKHINHFARCYGFYLLLKAESPGSGLIQNYTKQLPVLVSNFNISKRIIFYVPEAIGNYEAYYQGK